MPTTASQVLADGSRFSHLSTFDIKAVQLQLAADSLLLFSPGTNITVGAIMDRAEANGLCCQTRQQLRKITLQLLSEIKEAI